jgi:hypothetical protein
MVIIEAELPVGEIVPVRITGAMTYDLSGIAATNQAILAESQNSILQEE